LNRFLEEKFREDCLEEKVEIIEALYKQLTAKIINIEFKEDVHYFQAKKKF